MLRHYHDETRHSLTRQELGKQTAFHEAGHAAAIYIGNRQKHLPPVFFEIQINKPNELSDQFSAKVIDGQLIQSLPTAILENLSELSEQDQHSYQCAYEADVVNLLVGPLAEAKYVSLRDNEIFNFNLVNTKALLNYGGHLDVEKAYNNLKLFMADQKQREEKMQELFRQAYRFIDNHKNWHCIKNLADYILHSGQSTISCEEAIAVFDNCLA